MQVLRLVGSLDIQGDDTLTNARHPISTVDDLCTTFASSSAISTLLRAYSNSAQTGLQLQVQVCYELIPDDVVVTILRALLNSSSRPLGRQLTLVDKVIDFARDTRHASLLQTVTALITLSCTCRYYHTAIFGHKGVNGGGYQGVWYGLLRQLNGLDCAQMLYASHERRSLSATIKLNRRLQSYKHSTLVRRVVAHFMVPTVQETMRRRLPDDAEARSARKRKFTAFLKAHDIMGTTKCKRRRCNNVSNTNATVSVPLADHTAQLQ